jgi:HCOMODA/2-hydroxy-3-carboxy-muconic semialdehyde decarboxylase
MQELDAAIHRRIHEGGRALARAGLATAFGHCSIRRSDATFIVTAAKPPSRMRASDVGSIVPVGGPLPPGVLGEVRLHREIYRRRGDVGAVCRFASPQVIALAAMGLAPSARHGFGAYFYPRPPLWPGTALIRDDASAARVAEMLEGHAALVLGVNGAITAASSLERCIALAWFLEDAARVELTVRAAGGASCGTPFASAREAEARATWEGRVAERVWEHLVGRPP